MTDQDHSTEVGLREVLAELPLAQKAPKHCECLVCYVYRMWRNHGAGGQLELAGLYRTYAASKDTTLIERLLAAGVGTDRELVFSVHRPNEPNWDPTGYCSCHKPVDGVPWCHEVVRGSTAACDLWLRSGNERPAGAHKHKRLWG